MPDALPPSVPTGSARAARTAGKKLEFARQYWSECPVPIQLISRHARSLDATRKLQRIRTHKKRNRESPKWIAVSGPLPESTDCEARSARMAAVVKGFGCRPDASVRPGIGGPAAESPRRTNPRESDERLIVYGDLARQRLWRGMFFGRSLGAESR